MPVDSLKRIWPVFVTPKVRDWFNEHLISGTLERIVIAVNAPLETLKDTGPPVPDDGLSIDALATNCLIRPSTACRRCAMPTSTCTSSAATPWSSLGKATADMPSGRKLTLSAGVVRSARHGAARAAGARAFQDRRSGAGRRRAFAHGPPARRFRLAVRSGGDAREYDRAGHAGDAAEGRSAPGIDELCDRRRCHELLRRPHDHGAESRGSGAASERDAARLPAQGRRQDRRAPR